MKRKFILAIIASLMFNNLLIVGELDASVKIVSPVIKYSVFQTVCFARLPFLVVSNIMKDTPLFPEYEKHAKNHGKKSETKRDENWLCFVNNVEKRTSQKIVERCNLALNMTQASCNGNSLSKREPPPGWIKDAVHRFMLTYLVELSRGNLPWAMTNMQINL